MTVTYLELKLLLKFFKCLAIIVLYIILGAIHANYVNRYTYDKEYWRFQNNSFKTLLKGSDKDKLYIINHLLENNDYRHDIMISMYMITYLISMVHNNTEYVNVPKCMGFLNYKINFTELYDFLMYNLIFNFWITFPIIGTIIQVMHSIMPYIPAYKLICTKIFLNVAEKIFKIMCLKENKLKWKLYTKKTV